MSVAPGPADPRPELARVFSSIADSYDAVGVDYFSVFAHQLVDEAALQPGERVLDVGTGSGAVLLEAAGRVVPDGTVVGVDLAPGMVARTAAEIASRGLANASVQVGDAQELGLAHESFDVVTASLVVFFLPDPAMGVRGWHDVLVPGGRLAMTTFAGDDERWKWQDALFAPYMTELLRRRPHQSVLSGDGPLHELLAGGGFVDVTSTVRLHDVVYADAEQWIRFSHANGQRAFWDRVPAEEQDMVHAAARERLAAIGEPDGSIVLHQPLRYTLAHRPA